MIRSKDSARDAKKCAKKKRPTAPVAFEFETDTTARRRQERQKQRGESAPQLKAQQTLARVKKTEEHAHLRLRHRHSADERKRNLHTNGSAAQAPIRIRQAHPELQPQTARDASSEAPTLRAVLEWQRPQSAKPSRQQGVAPSASNKELVAGTRIRVRHWENWLCHPTPTTTTQLMASQSSPLLRSGKGSHQSKTDARPADQLDNATRTAKKTNIVVNMRRLRVLDDSEEDYGDRRPAAKTRQAWGSDPATEIANSCSN